MKKYIQMEHHSFICKMVIVEEKLGTIVTFFGQRA